MSLASTLADSALGQVKKAFLIMHYIPAGDTSSSADLANQTDAVLLKAAALEATTGSSHLSTLLKANGMSANVLVVQYNPSSLSMSSNSQSIPFAYLQKNVDDGVPNQNVRPPQVTLSAELLFDAMNTQDAFMLDKLRVSAGTIVSNVAAAKVAKVGAYTVQPQTNALVGALMDSSTRFVTFRWGDMAFTGQITEVQADYTMFSVSGRPIRSRVRINITQQVESKADITYWSKAFDRTFTENPETGESGGKDAAQQLGNLLNLNAF